MRAVWAERTAGYRRHAERSASLRPSLLFMWRGIRIRRNALAFASATLCCPVILLAPVPRVLSLLVVGLCLELEPVSLLPCVHPAHSFASPTHLSLASQ